MGVRAARISAQIDAELSNRAEKELAAFVAAVSTLHGEEQALVAADDWLLELIALKVPCKGASPDLELRSVTIGAARRLARRLSTPSPAHAALALLAGILLLAAPTNAHAAHSSSRHAVTQDKLASVPVSMNPARFRPSEQKPAQFPVRCAGYSQLCGEPTNHYRSERIQHRRESQWKQSDC